MARPVVALLHGFLGFVRWGPFEYFRGVSQALNQANIDHLMPEVPSAGTVAERAEVLARKLFQTDIPIFGLVGYSMGGLDAPVSDYPSRPGPAHKKFDYRFHAPPGFASGAMVPGIAWTDSGLHSPYRASGS